MTNVFCDLSKWQPGSEQFLVDAKSKYDVKGAMVQITCSDDEKYVNQKGAYQVYNAYKTFGVVSVYHYFYGSPVTEANVFVKYLKKYGLDHTTLVGIDCEEKSIGSNATDKINQFFDVVYAAGYHNLCVYAADSWFDGDINVKKLKHSPKIWIARIGHNPTHKCDAWQYTWTAKVDGESLDLSYDYSGAFTHELPSDANQYVSDGKLFYSETGVNLYHDKELTKKRKPRWGKGSYFYGEPVKVGNTYRIKTAVGYVSANKKWVKKVE